MDAAHAGVTNAWGLFVAAPGGSAANKYGAHFGARVGIQTTAPTAVLHVAGNHIGGTDTKDAQSGLLLAPTVAPSSGVTEAVTAYIKPAFSGTIGTSYALYLDTFSFASGTANYALYAALPTGAPQNYGAFIGGRTGIAVTAPTSMLHVAGTLAASTNSFEAQAGIHFTPTVAPTAGVSQAVTVYIAPSFTVGSGIAAAHGLYVRTFAVAATNNYGLYVEAPTGAATGNYAAAIMGRTGINTNAPSTSYMLDVNGGLRASGASDFSSTLAVAGAATLSSTLAVTGATTLSSTLTVTDYAVFNGNYLNWTPTRLNWNSFYDPVTFAPTFSINNNASPNVFTLGGTTTVNAGQTAYYWNHIRINPLYQLTAVNSTGGFLELVMVSIQPRISAASGSTMSGAEYKAIGLEIKDWARSGAGTVYMKYKYGIRIDPQSGGGLWNVGIEVGATSGATNNYGILCYGNVGIGTNAPNSWLHVAGAITAYSGNAMQRIVGTGVFNAAATYNDLEIESIYTFGSTASLWSLTVTPTIIIPAGSTMASVRTIHAMSVVSGSGAGTSTLTEATGALAFATLSPPSGNTLTVTTYRGLWVTDVLANGAGTENVNNKYGIQVSALAATGTATGNHYGIYVDTVSGAATGNYGIISMSRVGIATATPTAMLHVAGNLAPALDAIATTSGVFFGTQVNPTVAVTNAVTLMVQPSFSEAGGGQITNAIGIRIGTYSVAATTNYGLYVDAPTSGGSNFGIFTTGHIVMGTAGNALHIKTGSNACAGQVTFSASTTATVTTTCPVTGDMIFVTPQVTSTLMHCSITTFTSGTSFVITCSASHSGIVNWMVIKAAP